MVQNTRILIIGYVLINRRFHEMFLATLDGLQFPRTKNTCKLLTYNGKNQQELYYCQNEFLAVRAAQFSYIVSSGFPNALYASMNHGHNFCSSLTICLFLFERNAPYKCASFSSRAHIGRDAYVK